MGRVKLLFLGQRFFNLVWVDFLDQIDSFLSSNNLFLLITALQVFILDLQLNYLCERQGTEV